MYKHNPPAIWKVCPFRCRMPLVTMIGLTVLVVGCLARERVAYQEMAQLDPADAPRSIAVLPFKNTTTQPELASLVRRSFYAHLSYRRFRDVEPVVVDHVLAEHGLDTNTLWTAERVRLLGDWLACDAVVIGKVDQIERIYAGVYSQLNIGASVSIHETRTGREIWSGSHVARLHEGDVPLTPLGLPLSGLRTGLNLHDREIVAVVDKLTRHLAEQIPDRGHQTGQDGGYRYNLQIGAFLDHQRALEERDRLLARGYPASVHSETAPDAIWHRVVVGPYHSEKEALAARAALEDLLAIRPLIRRQPL